MGTSLDSFSSRCLFGLIRELPWKANRESLHFKWFLENWIQLKRAEPNKLSDKFHPAFEIHKFKKFIKFLCLSYVIDNNMFTHVLLGTRETCNTWHSTHNELSTSSSLPALWFLFYQFKCYTKQIICLHCSSVV